MPLRVMPGRRWSTWPLAPRWMRSAAVPELFRITAGTVGRDLILNFRPGVDHLRLAGFGAGAQQAALAGARDSLAGTTFTLTGGVQVTLAGVHGASAGLFG